MTRQEGTADQAPPSSAPNREQKPQTSTTSMHEDIASWCDCCPCEPEPRWQGLADEMGIDLSDRDTNGRDNAG